MLVVLDVVAVGDPEDADPGRQLGRQRRRGVVEVGNEDAGSVVAEVLVEQVPTGTGRVLGRLQEAVADGGLMLAVERAKPAVREQDLRREAALFELADQVLGKAVDAQTRSTPRW